MTNCFIEFLKKQDVEYREFFDISKNSSIKIGGIADIALLPDSSEKMKSVLSYMQCNGIEYCVVGNMTNLLPRDERYSRVLLLTSKLDRYFVAEKLCVAEAGVVFSGLISKLARISLGGAEELYGIPGSVGGMIYGNAGAYGKSIGSIVESAEVFDSSRLETVQLGSEDLNFAYRHSILKDRRYILLSATFRFKYAATEEIRRRIKFIIEKRRYSQPYGEPSLGSVFLRCDGIPISKLIDDLGLKGYKIGGAKVSEKHAGFIVNAGGATSADVKKLIDFLKDQIYLKYGLYAKEEIEYM